MMILYNSITSYQKCHHWIPFLQWKLRNSYPSIRLRPFDFGLLPRPIFQPNFRILFSRAFARDQVNRGQPRPPKISFPEILFFFFFTSSLIERTEESNFEESLLSREFSDLRRSQVYFPCSTSSFSSFPPEFSTFPRNQNVAYNKIVLHFYPDRTYGFL